MNALQYFGIERFDRLADHYGLGIKSLDGLCLEE
jgi:hypothetical protein